METSISIVRGINADGHSMIKMDALRQLYADMSFQNNQACIQSGNVAFQHKETALQELEE